MKNSLLVHQHLIVRAEAARPPMDEEQLNRVDERICRVYKYENIYGSLR